MPMPSRSRLAAPVFALSVLWAAAALAHPVVVDGSPAEWAPVPGIGANAGILVFGEYVWQDAGGDERTDFSAPDTEADLTACQVTGTPEGLGILVRFADLALVTGDGSVMVQVAIDRDRIPGSGSTTLGGFSDTSVAAAAAWERLVMTRFASGSATPSVFDPAWNDLAAGGGATAAVSDTDDCVEIFVPWDLLGGLPEAPLRFTVATFRSDVTDAAWDVAGASDALDAVTNYGDPGLAANTWDEAGDGVIDAFFDVWFHLGQEYEPKPPLLITEILYDAFGAEPAEEWVEVANMTAEPLALAGFKLGDEEQRDGPEGMAAFPAGASVAAGDVVVVAGSATAFAGLWPFAADFEFATAEPAVPDMIRETAWATGLVNLGNSGDQLLLLDPQWTILDVVTWESGTYPGIIAAQGAIAGQSIARLAPVDTDDCSADFIVSTLPGPGEFTAISAVPGRGVTAPVTLHQNSPNPFNPATVIAFDLARAEAVTLTVHDAAGRLVRRLLVGRPCPAGPHAVSWDGRDDGGRAVAAGVYLYRIAAGRTLETRKMALLK